ncbi:MAG: Bax inhibitor-1 family protein [archaeon]|nr:Bax inhibitor-1 family protein [archaeon]
MIYLRCKNIHILFYFRSKRTQQHVTQVYFTLGCGIGVSVLTFLLNQVLFIPAVVYTILFIASIVLDIYNICTNHKNSKLRYASFGMYAFCVGGLAGCVTQNFSPSEKELYYQLCLSAFMMTTLTFFSFSVFAFLTQKRVAIYLGSLLTSLILGIIGLFIYNIMVEIVFGIIIACCYIIFDTQHMIHRAESGRYDVLGDAYCLFIDFVKLFFKFLQLMSKREEEKKKKEKEKQNK